MNPDEYMELIDNMDAEELKEEKERLLDELVGESNDTALAWMFKTVVNTIEDRG